MSVLTNQVGEKPKVVYSQINVMFPLFLVLDIHWKKVYFN